MTGILLKLNSPGQTDKAHKISTKALGFCLRHSDMSERGVMPSVAFLSVLLPKMSEFSAVFLVIQ
jgi:hypothetical protein